MTVGFDPRSYAISCLSPFAFEEETARLRDEMLASLGRMFRGGKYEPPNPNHPLIEGLHEVDHQGMYGIPDRGRENWVRWAREAWDLVKK